MTEIGRNLRTKVTKEGGKTGGNARERVNRYKVKTSRQGIKTMIKIITTNLQRAQKVARAGLTTERLKRRA